MSRLMSVALTERAVIERRKTVTRRLGWVFLKPGDRLTLCRKVMGQALGRLECTPVGSVPRRWVVPSIDPDVQVVEAQGVRWQRSPVEHRGHGVVREHGHGKGGTGNG